MWNKFHFCSFSFKERKIMKSYIKIILCLIFMISVSERVFALTLVNEKVRIECPKNWQLDWQLEPYYKFKNCWDSYYGDGFSWCGTYRFQKAF